MFCCTTDHPQNLLMPLFLVLIQSDVGGEVHWDLVEQHGADSLKENGRMGVNSQTEGWNVKTIASLWET